MSIRRIQTGRLIEEVARSLYAEGTKPTLGDIFQEVAKHFTTFPAGKPLPIPDNAALSGRRSDTEVFNTSLLHTAENIDVLYEVLLEQVDELMMLSAALQAHLGRLHARRRRVEAQVDDYLLSLYNTDGYFYSASDTFADIGGADLEFTSAQIDTETGCVLLPTIASLTRHIPKELIRSASIRGMLDGNPTTPREISSFRGAVETSLTNTKWELELDAASPVGEAAVMVDILFSEPVDVSRIDFTPHGVTPMTMAVQAIGVNETSAPTGRSFFGNRVLSGADRMMLVDRVQRVAGFTITFVKNQYDYASGNYGAQGGGSYRYIFGAKNIAFIEQAYEGNAIFVSGPLYIPSDLATDMVIDAVTLVVDNDVPSGTNIDYYVAADTGETALALDDMDWRPIVPIGSDDGTIVHFDGAKLYVRMIRSSNGEIDLIPEDASANDVTLRNPTPAYIPGQEIWRICEFTEDVIPTSVRLEEGINTTRISYTSTIDAMALRSLEWWSDTLLREETRVAYGRIDAGNDFFYGGDIGESDVSVMVETYIDSDIARPTFLAECSKADPNSQMWPVRVFLNGAELGMLPVGTHKAMLPWTLREGRNHIILLADIPSGRSIGTIRLMGETRLHELGTVKLADWSNVSFFDLQYNTTADATMFAIHDGHLISRRRPTDNFRLFYGLTTGKGPDTIRFRADLSHGANSASLTPRLNSYRVRFAYGEEI